MTRKLRNSLNALLLTSMVCATAAVATAALPFVPPVPAGAVAPAAAAAIRMLPDADVRAVEAPVRRGAGKSRLRTAAGMPYFSFVPRG